MQVEAELLPPGKDNPWGNAFVKKETDLVDESTSGRVVDCLKARFWKIKNPSVRHEFSGKPRSRLAEHRNSAVLFSVPPLCGFACAEFPRKLNLMHTSTLPCNDAGRVECHPDWCQCKREHARTHSRVARQRDDCGVTVQGTPSHTS